LVKTEDILLHLRHTGVDGKITLE